MFDSAYFYSTFFILIYALPLTFLLALGSFFIGGFLGFCFALARLFELRFVSGFLVLYVSFFRGTPLLVQLFMFYYGLPIFFQSQGIDLDFHNADALIYALVVFSLYASAYLCEVFRAALLSVDKGQIEAAYSLGMSRTQALWRIILPQAFMITLPNLLNFFVLQVKNTALASIITVPELMGLADIESGRSSKFLEVYLMVALIYWGLCVALEAVFARLEKKLSRYRKGYAK